MYRNMMFLFVFGFSNHRVRMK